ncbi:hypothetical protein JAAARDRAFT_330462 [Jaapia argillacea MUCL 33604]|uniref:Uncharacterized protein n=1 Tax=Jaapia argillacea MUCL 33604 TaxID=933084 RepID=A0A067PX04_9AGAM|nr:hypothetical protein JAAARDRAFT_330462 [Jaapia argillacea MUCL 33604]
MNLRVSTRRNNRRHHRDESTDFVDIRAGAEVRSDEGHLNMKESMFSGPKSQSLSYSFDVPTPLPRPIGEYTPSPPGQSDRRYSDVLDISPQSGGITQVHARDSSRGALLADYGNNERIGRRIVDVPHSPSPSRRSEDYPTSASGTDPEENLFTASRRPSAHVYATARPIESPIEEEAHYLSVENVSPLEVDFSNIGQSEADHQNRPPSVQPQTIQLPQLTVQSATPRSGSNIREPITSFLDLSSTASSSQKHTSSSDQSVYSSFYATEAGPSRPISSSNQFRPASLSISVDNSRRGTLANPVPPSPHRFRAADIDSPTDSVPVSVSEIQFRHSEDADSDVVSSYRPPHPPLSPSSGPGRMAFVTPPLIAQKLLGREPGIGTSTSFTMPRPAGPRSPSYPSSSRNPSEQRSQW